MLNAHSQKFKKLAEQSQATTDFNLAWKAFRTFNDRSSASDLISKADAVLEISKETGKQMLPETNILHRKYIAEDFLRKAPVEKAQTSSNTEYEMVRDPKSGRNVYAKVTKLSFGS